MHDKIQLIIGSVFSLMAVNLTSFFVAFFDLIFLTEFKEVINIFVSLLVGVYWVVKIIKEKKSSKNGK